MGNIVTWGEEFKEAYLFLLIKNAQFFSLIETLRLVII